VVIAAVVAYGTFSKDGLTVVVGLAGLFLAGSLWSRYNRKVAQFASFAGETWTYAFDERGLRTESISASTRTDWSRFTRVERLAHAYILWQGTVRFEDVPSDGLTDEQHAQLTDLFVRHLPRRPAWLGPVELPST
jgi:hypothetical protein